MTSTPHVGRRGRRLAFVIVFAATVVGSLGVGAGAAFAHAELTATSPAGGTRLDASPQELSVTFGEAVDFGSSAIRLYDAAGHQLDTGPATHPGGDGRTITTKPQSLGAGTYVVSWRAVSQDAHPVQGAFTFSVGAASPVDTRSLSTRLLASSGASSTVGFLFGTARVLVFAGLALLIGGVLATLLLWPGALAESRTRRLLWGAVGALLVGTIASIGLQGAYANGGALGDLAHFARWREVLATRYGRLAVVRLALVLLAGTLLRRLRPAPPPAADAEPRAAVSLAVARAATLVAVGLVATVTLAGHATTGRWQAVAIPADLVHVLAMSVWLGGLAIVLAIVLPFAVDGVAAEAVQRFSRLATGAVVALVVTGAFQSWRQVGHLSSLNTDYGRALTWKLRIVVVMVAAAALSRTAVRQWLDVTRSGDDDIAYGHLGSDDSDEAGPDRAGDTRPSPAGQTAPNSVASATLVEEVDPPALLEPDEGLRRRLRATVLVEVVLAIAVLAVTAALVTTRPAYEAAGGPVSVTMVDRDTVTTLTLDPARAGANELHVYVNTAGGSLNQVQSLTVEASLPGRNIGPLPIAVDRSGPNHFTASAAELPIAGRWQITIRARVSEFDERSFTTTVTVR